MFENHRNPWKILVLGSLLASALGAGYLGFQGAGGIHDSPAEVARQKAERAAREHKKHFNDDGSIKKDDDAPKAGDDKEDSDETEMHKRLKKFFSDGDDKDLDGLLPKGVGELEGMGGKGLGRQVKSNGKWYPVFDLSKAGGERSTDGSIDEAAVNPEHIDLTRIPLSITSPNPPQGAVGQIYNYHLSAIGGTPPYRWMMQAAGSAAPFFALDPGSGLLTGSSPEPVNAELNVFVSDSAGGQASTVYSLVIAPGTPLAITTATLPVAQVGQAYQTTLEAEGGVAPYTWSLLATSGAWQCDPTTGMITGTPTQAEEVSVQVNVTDAQRNMAQKSLDLKVSNGLDISTDTPLPPAAPSDQYTLTFQATGGTAPYTWKMTDGALPDGWTLSPDGLLSGMAAKTEAQYQFTVEVADTDGLTFHKPVALGVVQALIVVPSRERAGLAWQPLSIMRAAGTALQSVSIERTGAGTDVEVYRGLTLNNIVDHNLVTGASYDYTLTAHTVDGRTVPFGATHVKILPMTLTRAVPGITGDPYADRVKAFNPLSAASYGAANLPGNVTGPPDGRSTFSPAYMTSQVASLNARLGAGGSITLEFTDNIVELGPGADFTVFENVMFQNGDPNQRFMEPAVVEVALFDGQWYRFPINVNKPVTGSAKLTNPAYYAQGFAGVNATTGGDPTNPSQSGGDSFDADALGIPGLSWIRFIRIQSTGHLAIHDLNGVAVEHTNVLGALSGGGSSGFDLDAVSAVNY